MKINELKTPCYVIDEGKLTENLKILHHVMQEMRHQFISR